MNTSGTPRNYGAVRRYQAIHEAEMSGAIPAYEAVELNHEEKDERQKSNCGNGGHQISIVSDKIDLPNISFSCVPQDHSVQHPTSQNTTAG